MIYVLKLPSLLLLVGKIDATGLVSSRNNFKNVSGHDSKVEFFQKGVQCIPYDIEKFIRRFRLIRTKYDIFGNISKAGEASRGNESDQFFNRSVNLYQYD